MAVAEQALPAFHTRSAIFAIQVGTFVRPASRTSSCFPYLWGWVGGKQETPAAEGGGARARVFAPPSVSEPPLSSNAEKKKAL